MKEYPKAFEDWEFELSSSVALWLVRREAYNWQMEHMRKVSYAISQMAKVCGVKVFSDYKNLNAMVIGVMDYFMFPPQGFEERSAADHLGFLEYSAQGVMKLDAKLQQVASTNYADYCFEMMDGEKWAFVREFYGVTVDAKEGG